MRSDQKVSPQVLAYIREEVRRQGHDMGDLADGGARVEWMADAWRSASTFPEKDKPMPYGSSDELHELRTELAEARQSIKELRELANHWRDAAEEQKKRAEGFAAEARLLKGSLAIERMARERAAVEP